MDMRRRKHRRKKIGNMSIIYISSILALSFMGVGYAAWNDGLNIEMAITTGDTFSSLKDINISQIELEDGEWLSFEYSDETQKLYIDGEVFPSFDSSIPIKLIDKGSIPTKLINIDALDDADITELNKESKGKYSRRMSFVDENIVEGLDLNINPENDKNSDNDNRSMQRFSIIEQDEINSLQEEIDEYKEIRDYKFDYKIILEQAL